MFPNAGFITSVAHSDIGIVTAQHHLCACGDNMAIAVDTGIDDGLVSAVANGFDLVKGIRQLHI